jgi:hypothetical protein
MNAWRSTSVDPVLERLHEVAERIRRRAAEGRVRELAKARRPRPASRFGQSELPLRLAPMPPLRAAPVPRHWADGQDDEQSAA